MNEKAIRLSMDKEERPAKGGCSLRGFAGMVGLSGRRTRVDYSRKTGDYLDLPRLSIGRLVSELHRDISTTIVAVTRQQGPMRTQQSINIHIERIGTRPTPRHHVFQTGPRA